MYVSKNDKLNRLKFKIEKKLVFFIYYSKNKSFRTMQHKKNIELIKKYIFLYSYFIESPISDKKIEL